MFQIQFLYLPHLMFLFNQSILCSYNYRICIKFIHCFDPQTITFYFKQIFLIVHSVMHFSDTN